MEILIGVDPEGANRDAITLGSVIARQFGLMPVLVHVYPTDFDFPSAAHVDSEWRSFLLAGAKEFLAECQVYMHQRLGWHDVKTLATGRRSAGQGLTDVVANRSQARAIVVGSASSASEGRFNIGSTADKLLHNSTVPVLTAPAGYARFGVDQIERIVVAFQNTAESRMTAHTAAHNAEQIGVPLELLTVLQRHRMYGSSLRTEAENVVLAQLRDDATAAHQQLLATLPEQLPTMSRIVTGSSISNALAKVDWTGAELLAVGSSRGGQLRRVCLGDITYRLLQASPVPSVVFTRRTLKMR